MKRKTSFLPCLLLVAVFLSGCFEREIETRARPERGRPRLVIAEEMAEENNVRRHKDKEWYARAARMRREEKAKKQMEREARAFETQLEREYRASRVVRRDRTRQRAL